MGTNLFVEGLPAPFVVGVKLPRSVSNFKELTEVTKALSEIDNFLTRSWHKEWPSYGQRHQREIRLISFRLTTPPAFQIFADPAWLAVLIIVLVGYKDLKASAKEIHNDASVLISRIRGLTERQAELLHIAVTMTLAKFLQRAEKDALKLAHRFHRTRSRLLGDTEEETSEIEIVVIDIERYRLW